MKWNRAILWFRNDLRLYDHEPLQKVLQVAREVVPVYCLDPRQWEESNFGFIKTGSYRTQFLFESLKDLKKKLQGLGSDLIVIKGRPEEIIPDIIAAYQAEAVFAHKEVMDEETSIELHLEEALFKLGVAFELFWGSTLYHIEDLPMPVQALPEVFTAFRKEVEKFAAVRQPYNKPDKIPTPKLTHSTQLPGFEEVGVEAPIYDDRSVLAYKGGESAALERLQEYIWDQDLLKTYKETRNGLLGADYSSKFSAWLAMGCISPRKIYQEVKQYEKQRKKNQSTYWLIFELIWRDFFRFIGKKHGNKLFYKTGIQDVSLQMKVDWDLFEAWRVGKTGVPFVDANMREIKHSGFMSNRGRQNVASFLVKDLGLDWRMGAEYFESMLIDYDVCSNWGNWNYVSGVGNDPRKHRYFNVVSQANRYDPKGEYVRHWVGELRKLPASIIHEPWNDRAESAYHGVELGVDYPYPEGNYGLMTNH